MTPSLPSRRAPAGGGLSQRRRHAFLAVVFSAVVLTLAGCGSGGVTGSGPTKIEVRSLDPFTRVEVSNGIGLTIQVGDAQVVEVEAQENVLALITTTVEGGVLTVRGAASFTTSTGVTVNATVAALDGISLTDGSQARVDGLEGDQLTIDLSAGAALVATGRAMNVSLASSGGARADLAALPVDTMSVNLSGGATAALNVSDRLSGSAAGGAVATVAGGALLDVQASGGASVTSD